MQKYNNLDKNSYLQHLLFTSKNLVSTIDWAFYDVKLKFKRTKLGLFWEFLSILILSTIISLVFSIMFQEKFYNYFQNILLSYTTWNFISKTILDSTKLITGRYNAHIINTRLPIISYSTRSVLTNLIIYFFYLPFLVIIYFFSFDLRLDCIIYLLIGLLLTFLNLLWISNILSILSARFRDLAPLINSIMAPMLILTPILWDKSKLGEFEFYAYLNPFTSFIEVIKNPLMNLNNVITPYLILILMLLVGNVLSFLFYRYKGKQFIFWAH